MPELRVVGDRHRRNATEEDKSARVRADPVGKALGPGSLGKGIVRRAEGSDEQLRPSAPRRSSRRTPAAWCRRSRRTGARRRHGSAASSTTGACPGPIELAEAAVAVPSRMRARYSSQSNCSVTPGRRQFAVDRRPVGRGRWISATVGGRGTGGPPALRRVRSASNGQLCRPAGLPPMSMTVVAPMIAGCDLAAGHAGGAEPKHVAELAHG